MKTLNSRPFLVALLGSLAALGSCQLTFDSVDCTECDNHVTCHNHYVGDVCECDAGYTLAHPGTDDLRCERIPSRPGTSDCTGPNNILTENNQCVCDEGYVWCDPEDDDDLTCCVDDSQGGASGDSSGSDSGGDTGDEPVDCGDQSPPDDSFCTEDGLQFCTNTDEETPQCGILYSCQEGAWVEDASVGDESCEFDGYDFSYGCWDNADAMTAEFICGDGPGTSCTSTDDMCVDDDLWQFCMFETLTEVSCLAVCTGEVELEGQDETFVFGHCDQGCQCCDDPVDDVCPAA